MATTASFPYFGNHCKFERASLDLTPRTRRRPARKQFNSSDISGAAYGTTIAEMSTDSDSGNNPPHSRERDVCRRVLGKGLLRNEG
jgi:hypothetical protein